MENGNVELKVELNVEEATTVVEDKVDTVVKGKVTTVVKGAPKNEKKPKQIKLTDVEITESTYVNFLAGMLRVAQCRGAFGFEESAKIYECLKFIGIMQQEKRAAVVAAAEEAVETAN